MSLADASQRMAEADGRRAIGGRDSKPVGVATDNGLFRTVEVFGWGEM